MKRVLDVGNCDPDHAAVTRFLTNHFEAQVDRARLPADTFVLLAQNTYDLVLVNRKLDEDYSDGIEIIRQMKANTPTAAIPVMLITNYAEHQETAIAAGALLGFGKLEYEAPQTLERVHAVLG